VLILISTDQSNQIKYSIRLIKTVTSCRATQGRQKQFGSGRVHGERGSTSL